MRTALLASVTALALALAAPGAGAATYPPDTTLTRVADPSLPRPGYLSPVVDPVFGTQITRIADAAAFGQPAETEIRHAYAKNEPWNADASMLMLDYRSPAPLLDGQTFALLGFAHQPSEAIWLNTNPKRTIGVAGNRLIEWNMVGDHLAEVVRRFSAYRRIDLGHGEGNLSADDRYAVLFGLRGHGRVDLLVYDLVRDRIVGRRSFRHATVGDGDHTFNNVTMAQSGRFVVAEYDRTGRGPREGIVSFRRGLHHATHLSANGGSHYDTCIDAAGRDSIVVGADHSRALLSVRLGGGQSTRLLPATLLDSAVHISCRNTERPGWAYVSQFAARGSGGGANADEVLAVKLDGSGTVERFAHEHHSKRATYPREPQAVPSRDGSAVLFASDWERPNGRVYAYVARQP